MPLRPIPKTWVLGLSVILILNACNSGDEDPQPQIPNPPDNNAASLTDAQEYFLEISLGSEMPNVPQTVKKWNEDVLIYVADTSYPELMEELKTIISEINDLSTTIALRQVATRAESNYLIYFGDAQTYSQQYEPAAASLVEDNWGVFWIYWDRSYRIFRGSMYVDTERTESLDCQKHLLREELTQSLGLMQDTDDYPNSIFYQSWTCGPQYADIDKELIRWQLSDDITAGMTHSEIIARWKP